jgi:hypothetical protein
VRLVTFGSAAAFAATPRSRIRSLPVLARADTALGVTVMADLAPRHIDTSSTAHAPRAEVTLGTHARSTVPVTGGPYLDETPIAIAPCRPRDARTADQVPVDFAAPFNGGATWFAAHVPQLGRGQPAASRWRRSIRTALPTRSTARSRPHSTDPRTTTRSRCRAPQRHLRRPVRRGGRTRRLEPATVVARADRFFAWIAPDPVSSTIVIGRYSAMRRGDARRCARILHRRR